jgi:hypothetical protein
VVVFGGVGHQEGATSIGEGETRAHITCHLCSAKDNRIEQDSIGGIMFNKLLRSLMEKWWAFFWSLVSMDFFALIL